METLPQQHETRIQAKKDSFKALLVPHTPITNPNDAFSIAYTYFSSNLDNLTPSTVSGLALRLGMTTTELKHIKRKPDHPLYRPITTAVGIITEEVEKKLLQEKSGQIGYIFWLKNMDDWADKMEVETTDTNMKTFIEEMQRRKEQNITIVSEQ